MTDVVNPKSVSLDQLLSYHKKISVEGKAPMICFIPYTYLVLKSSKPLRFTAFRCYTTIIFSFDLHNGAIHKHTVAGSISNLDAIIFRLTIEQVKYISSSELVSF